MKKKTKIVATISDKICTVEFLQTLFDAGMNVVRLNTAHQTPDEAIKVINIAREVSPEIAILVDTKGPEIRTVRDGDDLVVAKGDKLKIAGDTNAKTTNECLYVSYNDFVKDVPVGSSVLIDDGDVELKVFKKDDSFLYAEVENSGVIKRRKSVNVPNVSINLPSVTERDKEFIKMAIENDADFIAHSFVRNRDDVMAVQSIIDEYGSDIKIIAKIENQEGVDNLDDILKCAYGIMIARGDLAIEIPAHKVPVVQRMIVQKCVQSKRPVIVATQMLHSMIENPRPTRAEISDIAEAVYMGTDAIMLSGETAYGKYPVEAVAVMTRTAREIEDDMETNPPKSRIVNIDNEITATLAESAVKAALHLPVKAVIIDTLSGRTGRYISAFRGKYPVYAICYKKSIMRQMALSYGVKAEYMPNHSSRTMFLRTAMDKFLDKNEFSPDDLIIVVGGSFGASNGASFMEIAQIKNLQNAD
ncbi:MAG: pyruvate kinase [Bacteroidales bacterium]|nr:pyruvate kinase [Bacteroidales bacterium]